MRRRLASKHNLDKLKEAEATFLQVYPDGFADPAIEAIRKKHNVDQLVRFTQEHVTRANCNRPHFLADTLVKIVGRSSMISIFEKPRFRDFIRALDPDEKEALARAVEQRLFGRKRQGFEAIVDMLAHHKIAKWAVISAVPFYFAPRREAFVKPTTAKRIVKLLESKTCTITPPRPGSSTAGFASCWATSARRSLRRYLKATRLSPAS